MNANNKVRLIEQKKTISNGSSYYYKNSNISGISITISAAFGPVKTVTGLQIIPYDVSTKMKEVITIGDTVSRISAIDILKFYSQKDFYNAKFDLSYENDYKIDIFTEKELRVNKPFEYSKIEFELFKNQT
jgi:hypothetical protein